MSQEVLKALEAARDRLLRAQRVCSWCDQKFVSNEDLIVHVSEKHRPKIKAVFIDDFNEESAPVEMSQLEMARRNMEIERQGLEEYGFWVEK